MNEVDAAWLAGFMEGEGVFQISVDRRRGERTWYAAQISATNTSRALLERAHEIAGGSVYGPIGRGNARWKSSYRWSLRGPRLAPVLSAMLPFLVTKREQASLVLLLRSETKLGADPGNFGRKFDAGAARLRADYKLAMHALNHRGGSPVPDDQVQALERVRLLVAKAGLAD